MNLSQLLGTLLPGTFNFLEQVVGPASGSTKFAKAVQIAKLGAIIAAESGLISTGEAHDDFAITNLTQQHFDNVKQSGKLQRRSKPPLLAQIPSPASPPSPAPDPNKPNTNVGHIYDKHAEPPRTIPPAGLEEERGVVFIPPPADAPLHVQTPDPSAGRVFTTPDPLMRSAPIPPTGGPEPIPGPTTNVGPQSMTPVMRVEGDDFGATAEAPPPPPDTTPTSLSPTTNVAEGEKPGEVKAPLIEIPADSKPPVDHVGDALASQESGKQ